MPPQFLSIKNFEKYQHYKQRNPPWIKLYYEMLDDDAFIALSLPSRHHYMTLLLVAGRKMNLIPNNMNYLKKVMRLDEEPDLTELIQSGFLIASRKQAAIKPQRHLQQNALSETETKYSETDNSETESTPVRATVTVDSDWLTGLGQNPAYRHINLTVEIGKMEAWLALPKNQHRKKTRSFVLNWLNKIEAPMGNGSANRPPPPPPKNDPIGRGQWGKTYGRPEDHGYQ